MRNFRIKRVNIITCIDNKNGIGISNKIPWRCKEDMIFFKNITLNNIVIMGNNTFKSMNKKSLSDRINIILSKKENFTDKNKNIYYFDSIKKALYFCRKDSFVNKNIYIIGGEKIYNKFIINYPSLIDKIYVTKIYADYNCDTFFNFNYDNYKRLYTSELKNFFCKKNKRLIFFDINCYIKNNKNIYF